uniref:TSA: Wollemia nobilis Ref_Wollemi_Transcript_5788_2301 transcribed RNA sequence n=1 Tax=Wollemia nobilis TaxID=56998 RepID=A0A0C9QVH9_9CONI
MVVNMNTGKEQSEISEEPKPTKVLGEESPQNEVVLMNDNSEEKRMEDASVDAQSQDAVTREVANPQTSHFSSGLQDTSVSPLSDPLENDKTFGKPSKIARLLPSTTLEMGTSSNAVADTKVTRNDKATQCLKTTSDDDMGFLNTRIVNELLHDTSGTFPDTLLARNTSSGKLAEIQAQIKTTMEKAFWDGVVEGLARNPPDYTRVVGLVKEVRDELDALVPQSWKQELHESIDVELFSQILESGVQDVEYLAKLLDYALGLVLRLGAPARDSDTKAAHEKLVEELSGIVSGMGEKSNLSFAHALVKGLRFILEQIQVLKQDITIARIRALAPLIQGPTGVEYMQQKFTVDYGPFSMATSKLPQTVQWLAQVRETLEKERNDFNDLVEVFKNSESNILSTHMTGLPIASTLRTGSHLGLARELSNTYLNGIGTTSAGEVRTEVNWMSMVTLVRLGCLQIASRPVAANEDNTPETMKLNIGRLRNAQNDFQRIIVIATGLLLVRQTLAEKEVPTADIDDVLNRAIKQMNDLLSDPVITSHRIGQLLAQLCCDAIKGDQADINGQLMTRVLSRSLSAGDAVFARVVAAVQSSIRAVLLLGKGRDGCLLAEAALKRIGASSLIDLVVGVVDSLEVMASVSCQVHGQWYKHILSTMQ